MVVTALMFENREKDNILVTSIQQLRLRNLIVSFRLLSVHNHGLICVFVFSKTSCNLRLCQ